MANVSLLTMLNIKTRFFIYIYLLEFFIKSWNTFSYVVYFKSKKELNYDRFVDQNVLGASRLVHSDLRIYRISFFLLDIFIFLHLKLELLTRLTKILHSAFMYPLYPNDT